MGYDQIKRVMDLILAGVGIVVLFPVFLLIFLILKIEEPKRKTIFKQERIGREGNKFMIFKFRSLNEEAPDNIPSKNLKRDEFETRMGRIMRITGLDELPQLLNVLRGDMSIIGPRPLITEEGSIHENRMVKGIYSLRLGITGLAQIHGGNTISDQEKLYWDYEYLKNRSIFMDFVIGVKTVFLCVSGHITPKRTSTEKYSKESYVRHMVIPDRNEEEDIAVREV